MRAAIESFPGMQGTGGPRGFWRTLARRPAAMGAVAFLAILLLACIAAPLVAPYDPGAQDLLNVLSGPTSDHLLGTDTLGRDVLSRLIYGGQRSLLSIAEGLAVVLVLGVPLGLAAGYASGAIDRLLSGIADIVMAIPAIILILVVLAVVPQNEDVAMVCFGVLGAPLVMRVVRSATLKVREELYVTAARVAGLSHLRIVIRHILPRVAGPIIVQATIFAAYVLLFESGLAYLGLTGDQSTSTWGGMVGEASTVIEQQKWLLFPPGIVIALTIVALGLLGDAVRDVAVMDRASSRRRPPRARRRGDHEVVKAGHPSALLEVSDLSVALAGSSTLVVDNVSFEVVPGKTLGLVGESGCGKSVTALALLRLLPLGLDQAGGHVLWKGRDLTPLSERGFAELRGSSLALVSQEPQPSLDPTFRIGNQLTEVVRRHETMSRTAARRRAQELLTMVELPDPERVSQSYAHQLSGGMAQRVAIALALAGRPELLIADEPTTALDVTVQAEILALLRRLQKETGMAIILITHNWGVVADICDRTVVMYAGQVIERAGVQAVFDRPLHPYTAGLLEANPAAADTRSDLAAIPGSVPPPGSWPSGCRFAPRCQYATDVCRRGPIGLVEPEAGRLSRCVRTADIFTEVNAL